MELLVWVAVGLVAYFIIGCIVASILKLNGHGMTKDEDDFKTTIALWPAPVIIFLAECFIKVVTLPFGWIYRLLDKRF